MRYLKERNGKWHYIRRVPKHAAGLDARGLIQASLKTRSLDVAKLRRDAHERADDLYWQGIVLADDTARSQAIYDAARARVQVLGFEYRSAADLATADVDEIVRRLEAAPKADTKAEAAIAGLVDEPQLTVTQAMKHYLSEIALGETIGMSEQQKRKRNEQKTSAAAKFAEIVGDKVLLEITRADAAKYHRWWLDRLVVKEGGKSNSGNTANRGMGNMRKLFREYVSHLGLDLKNPFDGLSFSDRKSQQKEVLPFETDFIRDTLLQAASHEGRLNGEALAVFLVLVETGCRPSEICNLRAEDIHLSAAVPYISIRYQEERVIKTDSSVRDIPLIGVALAVMKRFPKGFPRYRGRETQLSAVLMKHLRARKLLPTEAHRVYSLRHSFEKRMLEAGLDYEFRRRILGHSVEREKYGDGGAMDWRREQLLKIALPFDAAIVP